MFKPGTVIDRYEIVEPIAGGGMGVVYRARHTLLGTEVALKVLLANFTLSEKVRTRFQQEAYVQANLKHPSIVNVTDMVVGEENLAIVMELVDGPSLEQVLAEERSGPWTLEQTMVVMKPVLDAVAHAHARGVVHRDIKPGNVLLDRSAGVKGVGTPKVSDFGLAKILSSEVAMTKTGARMGTVPYMAPEQFRGSKEIDACTDVYALGMMLWRLLAGRLPVEPDDFVAATELYTGRSEMPLLSDVVSTIPKTVSEVVRAALSVDPSDRPLDASELLRRMQRDRVVLPSLSKVAPAAKPKTRGSSDRWRANETAANARAAHRAETERASATLARRTERASEGALFDWGRFGLYVGIPLALVALLLAVTGVFGGGGSDSQVTPGVSDETTTQESGGADERVERGQELFGVVPDRIPAEEVPPEGFVVVGLADVSTADVRLNQSYVIEGFWPDLSEWAYQNEGECRASGCVEFVQSVAEREYVAVSFATGRSSSIRVVSVEFDFYTEWELRFVETSADDRLSVGPALVYENPLSDLVPANPVPISALDSSDLVGVEQFEREYDDSDGDRIEETQRITNAIELWGVTFIRFEHERMSEHGCGCRGSGVVWRSWAVPASRHGQAEMIEGAYCGC